MAARNQILTNDLWQRKNAWAAIALMHPPLEHEGKLLKKYRITTGMEICAAAAAAHLARGGRHLGSHSASSFAKARRVKA